MLRCLAALAIFAFTALTPTALFPQTACGPRGDVLSQLRMSYNERILWIGVTDDGLRLVEIHASEMGSWTLTTTDTDKWTCILATGKGWTWGPYGERA